MSSRFSRLASRRRFVVAGGSAVVATGLLAVPAGCRGKIYPGTLIFDSLDLGGMTRAQAAALVDQRLAPLRTNAITFRHGNRTWQASLADLGATIDVNAMLDTAAARGRNAGFVARYTTWLDAHDTDVIATPIDVDTPVLR